MKNIRPEGLKFSPPLLGAKNDIFSLAPFLSQEKPFYCSSDLVNIGSQTAVY